MPTARIIEQDRKTTQSGRAKAGKWTLEFENDRAQRHDPLTGWVGNASTTTQVRLSFDSKEQAIAYAEKHGLDYHVVTAPPVKLKLQAYADNFR
ncbi:ETC complex I subunit [Sphingomonas astaxanthinifaciens]|uniref:Oxidoreductase n=1 Tax=Sphingomonas astaxanthinifaciens DSM 22298 TaxID=1123267 RepID=A0ABQ5Z9M3_9SPHN|nr:ETC complex I subunit [Sphingomonas astaxanthinifaciens]GLR48696.1 oxidoreductase [Sphingomonas astaxanthinifaciens DSM 22298]